MYYHVFPHVDFWSRCSSMHPSLTRLQSEPSADPGPTCSVHLPRPPIILKRSQGYIVLSDNNYDVQTIKKLRQDWGRRPFSTIHIYKTRFHLLLQLREAHGVLVNGEDRVDVRDETVPKLVLGEISIAMQLMKLTCHQATRRSPTQTRRLHQRCRRHNQTSPPRPVRGSCYKLH